MHAYPPPSHTHTHTHTHARRHAHMHTQAHTHTNAGMHISTHTHTTNTCITSDGLVKKKKVTSQYAEEMLFFQFSFNSKE